MMLAFDHIVIGCTDLAHGTAWAEAALGVAFQPGGQHARFGTHNTLLGLKDGLYLEVIAVDPAAPPGPRWFGLADFEGAPRLINWVCRAPDLDAALAVLPGACGPAVPMERGDLRWSIAVPEDGGLPWDGALPTPISWAPGIRHPAARLAPSGVRLTGWEVHHPQAAAAEAALAGLLDDSRVRFVTSPVPGYRARFDTPSGPRVLS
ncbi:VOC family protein [Limimaricola sp.]|uniref:VOC family protein n=1 Tax=Limimaricola sp. TaxID=2211665 RepID=UPI003432D285